jgi:hypothetical protein
MAPSLLHPSRCGKGGKAGKPARISPCTFVHTRCTQVHILSDMYALHTLGLRLNIQNNANAGAMRGPSYRKLAIPRRPEILLTSGSDRQLEVPFLVLPPNIPQTNLRSISMLSLPVFPARNDTQGGDAKLSYCCSECYGRRCVASEILLDLPRERSFRRSRPSCCAPTGWAPATLG